LRQQEFDKEIAKTKGFNSEKSTALLKEIAENKSAADEIRKEVVIKEEQEKTKIAVKGFADRRKAKEDAEKKEKTDAENARKEALRIAEADRKAAFEIFVDSAQERADLAKKDSENESLPLQERLNRLIDFNGEMQSILLAQKDFDLENTKLTETEKLKIVNKLGIDTNKLIEEFTDRRNNILKTSRQNDIKKFEDSIENLKKESEKLLDNVLFGIDQTKNEELLQAAKDFNSGKIKTEEDYIKRKKEINDKADEAEFSAKIDHELKMLFIQKAAGKDVEQQIKNLQQLKKQYDEKEIADEEAKANKIIDINTRIKNAKKDLLKEGYETFISFVNASFEKEVLNLDESKRLLDEETKRKINAIQQLGLTEVERTKQISIVEKNAAFQTEQIEKRKREIAQSIAAIIQGTSVAVINALGAKPYGPQNLFLAGLVGAIGALQLARAIAQPIPKYKGGRGFGKKEIAEVGDGFKNEYILRESGNIEKTPSVPTLTQLMPRDIVFKDQNALAMAMINSANPYHKVMQQAQPSYIKSLDKEILGELKEIRKRSGISIHNNLAIESTAYYQNAIKN
jgi:hypothetical protein